MNKILACLSLVALLAITAFAQPVPTVYSGSVFAPWNSTALPTNHYRIVNANGPSVYFTNPPSAHCPAFAVAGADYVAFQVDFSTASAGAGTNNGPYTFQFAPSVNGKDFPNDTNAFLKFSVSATNYAAAARLNYVGVMPLTNYVNNPGTLVWPAKPYAALKLVGILTTNGTEGTYITNMHFRAIGTKY